jgi:hypothetical protein
MLRVTNQTRSATRPAARVLLPAMALGHKACCTLDEVLQILSRALLAAYAYETLRMYSDEELARRGMKRTDLARSTFHVLTNER